MKLKQILSIALLMATTTAFSNKNPFFGDFNTPHGTYPFNEIKLEHYMPAFEKGMVLQRAEIDAIANSTKPATFYNTIVALDESGALLSKVAGVFYNLTSAETNDDLQALSMELSPRMSDHANSINLNEKLFARVKAVYEQKDKLKLNVEEMQLLQNTYDGFVNSGANLLEADKETYRKLSAKLSMLTLTYGQNVLKETNKWSMLIKDETLLAGLTDDFKAMLAENAKRQGKEGWLLDLKPTTTIPFLKYAENRDLRRELWLANSTKCSLGGEFDNKKNIAEIVNTRLAISQLLGYKSYADRSLVHTMAENKENVYDLLDQLREAYMPLAKKEYRGLQKFAEKQGFYAKVQPWDFSFYSEQLLNQKFSINDELLRPYFELENVKKGVFGLATKLYGVKFTKNENIQVYHPEVDAYEVTDARGRFVGVFYADFHPREGKRAGAWMSEFKGQWMNCRKDSRPHITIVMNFTRPTADKPALLTYDEVTTFLHEFGHALHGLLTKCTYKSLSGTNVYRDFVELPSQLLENWASEKEFLDQFAVHYKTGEKIPVELIEKIKAADNFNVAYACLRQLSFGYLDMAWHTLETPFKGNVLAFEKKAMKSTDVLPVYPTSVMSPTFSHIFAGGYAAGYYSYKWAEVLDADAFSVFKTNGLFDKETADKFRENVLERGGTENPMDLYKRFRGQEPTIDALLIRNGVK